MNIARLLLVGDHATTQLSTTLWRRVLLAFASGSMRTAPSADRNKGPIGDVLARHPPFSTPAQPARCLEIASGTGQHVAHFATLFPHVMFQPTEYDGGSAGPEAPAYGDLGPVFASIAAHCVGLRNVEPGASLDAAAATWGAVETSRYGAIVACNVLHISPYSVSEGLFDGARRILEPGGMLFVYGPFKVDGVHTSDSNAAFDERLRSQNAAWGVRNTAELQVLAEAAGLELIERAQMPANNLCLIFRKR